jgi:uncharacterized protein YciI
MKFLLKLVIFVLTTIKKPAAAFVFHKLSSSSLFLSPSHQHLLRRHSYLASCKKIQIPTTTSTSLLSSSSSLSSKSEIPSKPWIVSYQYVHDILEKRGPYREQHLYYAKDIYQCLYGGPNTEYHHDDPAAANTANNLSPTGALFIFPTFEQANEFVQKDPYVINQLVTKYCLSEWNIVIRPSPS